MTSSRRALAAAVFLPLVVIAVLLALAGCATTVDPTVTTVPVGSSASTTTFVAGGTTAELLDELLTAAGGLSEAIVENEGQHEIAARIDTLWAAARPGVEDQAPDIVGEFDRAIDMMHTAVERRRPADADKARINLRQLIAALPAG